MLKAEYVGWYTENHKHRYQVQDKLMHWFSGTKPPNNGILFLPIFSFQDLQREITQYSYLKINLNVVQVWHYTVIYDEVYKDCLTCSIFSSNILKKSSWLFVTLKNIINNTLSLKMWSISSCKKIKKYEDIRTYHYMAPAEQGLMNDKVTNSL